MSDTQRQMTVDEIELDANNERVASLLGDDGTQLVLPLAMLPPGTKEGDVLNISFAHDSGETERRKQHVAGLQKKLFGDR